MEAFEKMTSDAEPTSDQIPIEWALGAESAYALKRAASEVWNAATGAGLADRGGSPLPLLTTRIDFQNRVVLSTSFDDRFWTTDPYKRFDESYRNWPGRNGTPPSSEEIREWLKSIHSLLFHGLGGEEPAAVSSNETSDEQGSESESPLPSHDRLLMARWEIARSFLLAASVGSGPNQEKANDLRVALVSVLSYIPQSLDTPELTEGEVMRAADSGKTPLIAAVYSLSTRSVTKRKAHSEENKCVERSVKGEAALNPEELTRALKRYERLAIPILFLDKLIPGGNLVTFPVYDTWVGDVGFGSICAFIHVLDDKSIDSESWMNFESHVIKPVKEFDKFAMGLEYVASELLAAGFSRASAHSLASDASLPELLAATVGYVQNWDGIRVAEKGKANKWWMRKSTKYGSRLMPAGQEINPDEYFQDISPVLLGRISTATGIQETTTWTQHYLPDITNDEIARYRDLQLAFYPSHRTKVPADPHLYSMYAAAIRRTLLRLINLLLLRLRSRRAALRSAAVSIMGRNMSHNIGSHVLEASARKYFSLAEENIDSTSAKEQARKIGELMSYLQLRMDFLAELATADSYFGQTTDLNEVIGTFNESVSGGHIQEYITATRFQRNAADTPRSVKFHVALDINESKRNLFHCPGGSHGVHALYVILENFIRNVAKHHPNKLEAVNCVLEIVGDSDDKPIDGHLRLRLTDRHPDRLVSKEKINRIKKVIKHLVLVDSENRPIQGDWGLREMYISAAYLRGIPLADLEAPVLDDGLSVLEVSEEDKENGHLGYEFYLRRPNLLTVVVDQLSNHVKEKLSNLRREGVSVMTAGEFERYYVNRNRPCLSQEVVWQAMEHYEKVKSQVGVWRAWLPATILRASTHDSDEKDKRSWFRFWTDLLTSLQNGAGDDAYRISKHQRLEALLERSGLIDNGIDGVVLIRKSGDLTIPENAKFVAIYDHHGSLCENLDPIVDKSPHFTNLLNVFYEYYITASPQSKILSGNLTPTDEMELKVAAVTKLVIIDERAQQIAARDSHGVSQGEGCVLLGPRSESDLKKNHFLERGRIYVPKIDEMDLYRPEGNIILNWINKLVNIIVPSIGFMVIHQTILEKLEGRGELAEFLAAIDNILESRVCRWRLILCSGRGVPWAINTKSGERRIPFVPVSSLFEFMDRRQSKLHLIRLLEASRAPRSLT